MKIVLGGEQWPAGASIWSGCSVRIRLWPRLPRDCHRLLSILPTRGASVECPANWCSSPNPTSAGHISCSGSTGLGVHAVSCQLGGGGGLGGAAFRFFRLSVWFAIRFGSQLMALFCLQALRSPAENNALMQPDHGHSIHGEPKFTSKKQIFTGLLKVGGR